MYGKLVVLVLLSCNIVRAANQQSDADWLFDRYIDLTDELVSDRAIPESERRENEIGLYRFAFDYWLISRTNQIAAPFHWRGRIRGLFHRLNNAERFHDPAAIAPFFETNGQIFLPPFRANIPGIDRDNLTVAQYRDLVERFDLAFADFYVVFPPDPPPTNGVGFASPELESAAGPFAKGEFEGTRWPAAHLEILGPHKMLNSDGQIKLEKRYRDTPGEVFLALTPKAQAYYLPAFLQFCERNPSRSQDVFSTLLEQLTGRSKDAALLRGELTPMQKKVIVAYFEAWCVHDVSRSMVKKLHRTLSND
jgi:hypothetical protein